MIDFVREATFTTEICVFKIEGWKLSAQEMEKNVVYKKPELPDEVN